MESKVTYIPRQGQGRVQVSTPTKPWTRACAGIRVGGRAKKKESKMVKGRLRPTYDLTFEDGTNREALEARNYRQGPKLIIVWRRMHCFKLTGGFSGFDPPWSNGPTVSIRVKRTWVRCLVRWFFASKYQSISYHDVVFSSIVRIDDVPSICLFFWHFWGG